MLCCRHRYQVPSQPEAIEVMLLLDDEVTRAKREKLLVVACCCDEIYTALH